MRASPFPRTNARRLVLAVTGTAELHPSSLAVGHPDAKRPRRILCDGGLHQPRSPGRRGRVSVRALPPQLSSGVAVGDLVDAVAQEAIRDPDPRGPRTVGSGAPAAGRERRVAGALPHRTWLCVGGVRVATRCCTNLLRRCCAGQPVHPAADEHAAVQAPATEAGADRVHSTHTTAGAALSAFHGLEGHADDVVRRQANGASCCVTLAYCTRTHTSTMRARVQGVLSSITSLKKLCNHPRLVLDGA